ncbi:marvel domain-containing protein [Clohesyomyces aquaticus]|uniref:Marvel domain-containing protein n=1 Tax=Clohesyomyces aquaticus TaxID=1231657 RepID=A0A1Y1ZEQ5_9PLEO|nr:marvel domain-containing protein [Clohesyomyces aquaticus]
MSSIVNLGLRGLQVLFAIIIIGLTANLINGQVFSGTLPAIIAFTMFTGAFGMLGAILGIASNWVEVLQSILMAGIDALTAFFYLAGGVVLAYKLRGLNCGNTDTVSRAKMTSNELLNGGCAKFKQGGDKGSLCGYAWYNDADKLNSRCKMNEADAAFMFLSVIVLCASVVMMFLHIKRNK